MSVRRVCGRAARGGCSEPRQPEAEPITHGAGVAGNEDPPVPPEYRIYALNLHSRHKCQGAAPDPHMSLSRVISR